MQEGRSIMSQVISVMVALVMIGMFGYILATNTRIWDGFSRQSQASNKLREYSEYAAYDGTACRGQDILSLISKTRGDPFVLVYNGASGLAACSYNDYTKELQANKLDLTGQRIWLNEHTELSLPNSSIGDMCNGVQQLSNCSVQQLQTFFLGSSGSYASYNTYIVYEDESVSTVVGIIAVRTG